MNFKKIKWMSGVLFVFLLILATNLIDQKSFREVQDSIETIYEDRLIAQKIVFKINLRIQEKDMANAMFNQRFFSSRNANVNDELDKLLSQYEKTKLTAEENTLFEKLTSEIQVLRKTEPTSSDLTVVNQEKIESQIKVIKQDLDRLIEIQLEEGKREMHRSRKAVQTSELFSQMEIVGLIILAIIFQLIIISGPKLNREPRGE